MTTERNRGEGLGSKARRSCKHNLGEEKAGGLVWKREGGNRAANKNKPKLSSYITKTFSTYFLRISIYMGTLQAKSIPGHYTIAQRRASRVNRIADVWGRFSAREMVHLAYSSQFCLRCE
ncbi:hypothetical protein A7K72_06030 [Candidatus Methylacidiphilum fumarolicum]|nr:hypothetical protein A7K72_06030 [Candidatus Methylacidiphilum fumarolicum]